MASFHEPVLLEEVIRYLKPAPNQNFIDCTVGGGGHARKILEKISPQGRLLGIDLDPAAIAAAKKATAKYQKRTILINDNYRNLRKISEENNFDKVNGILIDLGLSQAQIKDEKRGFSFLAGEKLDMRFGREAKTTASEIINTYQQEQLEKIFKEYGQERLARPLAKMIMQERKNAPILQAGQLAEIAAKVYQKFYRHKSKINPATKIFQALRIAVNDELENLKAVMPEAADLLKKRGRLAIISFHSLEDRMVKDYFRRESRDCQCPPEMPICQCHHEKTLKIITKKPITATLEELAQNPKARSAKLRVAEKI